RASCGISATSSSITSTIGRACPKREPFLRRRSGLAHECNGENGAAACRRYRNDRGRRSQDRYEKRDDDHPGDRRHGHLYSALLLSREAGDRRELSHVFGRSREGAEAAARVRHAGGRGDESTHAFGEGARVAKSGDGIFVAQ